MSKKKQEKRKTDKEQVDQAAVNGGRDKAGSERQDETAGQQGTKDSAADSDPQTDEIAVYQERIETLESQLDESRDKFLRLFSEFDNFRKRVGKERIELAKTAAEGVITALLPVLDDLERASQVKSRDELGADDGVQLIFNKFKSILRQKGVEEVPAQGQAFDTDYHEAITHVPASDDQQKGMVVEEVQKGYMLNGKVIRFARVVVAN